MPRNMSFAMTTAQFKARTKDVTRRYGWGNLKPGDRVMGVEKAMGLKKGEKIVQLGMIEIVSNRPEPLNAMTENVDYGFEELRREGYPFGIKWPSEFVDRIASHYRKKPHDPINRIEYKYIDE